MIKVRFSGGLGNQLYQLGFLWYLQRNGVNAVPDFCEYTYYDFHQGLELNKLLKTPYDDKIRTTEDSRRRWYKFFNEKLGFWLRFHYHRILSERFSEYIVEDEAHLFDGTFLSCKDNVTLKGHWQKLEYLLPVQDLFCKNMHYNSLTTDRDKKIMEQISKTESVSIHIRRGDYLKEMQYLVIKGFSYYNRAIELVKAKYPEASFYVFSDDMEWVRRQMQEKNMVFVDWNKGSDSFKDMLLMSLCKHNIIANSTFSWWGAFLNANPHKMVVCPDEWLVGQKIDGRVPADWIKIKAC